MRNFFDKKAKPVSASLSFVFLLALSIGVLLSVPPVSLDFGGVAAAAKATKEAARAEKETYSVQVGAFRNKENAIALVKKLKKRRYDAFILNETGQAPYKVLIGRFGSRQEAAVQAKVVLKKEGMKSIIFSDASGRLRHAPAEVTSGRAQKFPVPVTSGPPKVESVPPAAKSPGVKAAPAEVGPAPRAQSRPAPVTSMPKLGSVPPRAISPPMKLKTIPAEERPAPAGIVPASPFPADVSVELTANKTSPAMVTTAGNVAFIPHATGGSGRYVFKFWLKGPSTGNVWKVVQDYAASAFYSWSPTVAGSYAIWVCARDASSPAGPEASAWMSFDVLDNPPVASVELTADKTSPALRAPVGRVTFTARAAGGNGEYEYKFWLKGPSTGNVWSVAQDYGISDSFTWTPTQAGHYLLWLYARNTGSPAAREAAIWTSFDVVDNLPVRSVKLTADKTSPLPPAAGGITFTAHAAGGSGKYEYEFWLKGPSTENAWEVVQDYGVSDAFLWTPGQAGDYSVAVYARNAGSPAGHEAIAGVAFDITGK
jgi:hypothetical protein